MAKRELSKEEKEVIERITIPDYFNKYVRQKKKGLSVISIESPTSICPFHDENDPSFHYWHKHKMYHCFGCGASGDVISLHQKTQAIYNSKYLDRKSALAELVALYQLQDIIKLGPDIEKPKSVFEKAREKLDNNINYIVPKNTLTLVKYRTMNDRIIKSNLTLSQKITEFEELDMMACLVTGDFVIN